MKSYTDLEQSKKLAKILPVESADMYWSFGNIKFMDDDYDDSNVDQHVPAWSLAALLGVFSEPYQLTSNKEGKVQLMLIHHLEKDYYDNPVDACVAMIERLHELKML